MPDNAATALSILVAWANDQDNWVRALVSELVETRRALADDRIRYYHGMLLREKELAAGPPVVVPALVPADASGDGEEQLTLAALKNVRHVNALAPDQEIQFNPRMTVLFGENAAGKTGYVRVLKRAASVRTAEPILPNIRDAPSAVRNPAATISFKLGTTDTTIEWQGEAGTHPLTRVDVFDARAAVLHVDEELLTYTYTPSDLALFRLAHEGIEAVKQRLDTQRSDTTPAGNPFLSRFARDTAIYPKIESLGPATDLLELEGLARVPEEEERGLDDLRAHVEALASRSADDRLQLAQGDRTLYTEVKAMAETIKGFSLSSYRDSLTALRAAQHDHDAATQQAFSEQNIPRVLEDEWRQFIRAGEDYLQRIGNHEHYPEATDSCLYCRQPLGEAALTLLRKYRAFCNDALAQSVQRSADQLDRLSRPVLTADIARVKGDLATKSASYADPQSRPSVLTMAIDLVALGERLQSALRDHAPLPDDDSASLAAETDRLASERLTELAGIINDLGRQASERRQLHLQESSKLRNLEARLQLRDQFPQISAYVEAAKWADKARAILARFPAVQRSLTETSKIASEQLLNHDFERLFEAERVELRAPQVSLDFPGRRGEAARRKTLVPDHKLSEILSEGEQKVVALADFIAEASLRRRPTPLVFDDPVNSLDYKRRKYVATRLVQLSETRQVVLFTHSILLATDVLSYFEHNRTACTFYNISEDGGLSGYISAGTGPRTDTFKDYRARINKQIELAERAPVGEGRNASIEKAYELMRGACETIVETDILCGVARRYEPNIRMTQLPNVRISRLQVAIEAIIPIFEKCCRNLASHSQPIETLSTRPSLAELKADWQALQDARTAYLA